MLNGSKYFSLSRIFSGSEGQQAADPRVHADIRQRNKDGGPGNWENSAQLFNLQVKRKELLTKFLLYKVQRRLLWSGLSVFWFWCGKTLCKQRLYGCMAGVCQDPLLTMTVSRISYCSADATFTHVFAFIAVNRAECLQCHAFLARKQKIVSRHFRSCCQASSCRDMSSVANVMLVNDHSRGVPPTLSLQNPFHNYKNLFTFWHYISWI